MAFPWTRRLAGEGRPRLPDVRASRRGAFTGRSPFQESRRSVRRPRACRAVARSGCGQKRCLLRRLAPTKEKSSVDTVLSTGPVPPGVRDMPATRTAGSGPILFARADPAHPEPCRHRLRQRAIASGEPPVAELGVRFRVRARSPDPGAPRHPPHFRPHHAVQPAAHGSARRGAPHPLEVFSPSGARHMLLGPGRVACPPHGRSHDHSRPEVR